MKKVFRFSGLCILLMIVDNAAMAQPFTLDDRINPTELLLLDYKKEDTIRRGKINVSTVTQVRDTAYYFVKGLSMFSPVYFGLSTPPDSGNLKVILCKDNWKTANREGETGNKGHYQEQFRTEGDFGIMVIAERRPASYTMITWMGNEAKDVGISSPFKEGAAVPVQGGNFLKNNYLYLLIGLLVLLAGYLIIKMKKNQKQSA